MKAFFFTILFVLGGACAAASAVATDFTADAAASCIKQLRVSTVSTVSCLSAEGAGAGVGVSTEAEAFCSLSSECSGCDFLLIDNKNLTGGDSGTLSAAPDQYNFSSVAAATAVSTARCARALHAPQFGGGRTVFFLQRAVHLG